MSEKPSISSPRSIRLFLTFYTFWHLSAVCYSAIPTQLWLEAPQEAKLHSRFLSVMGGLRSFKAALDNSKFPLAAYCMTVGVNQSWNTFAPQPPVRYAHYTVIVDGPAGRQMMWNDGFNLERYGAGLVYNPTVKLTSMFGLPLVRFQEAFLRYHARSYQLTFGVRPDSVVLHSRWKRLEVRDGWRVVHLGPFETDVMTRGFR